MFARIYSFAVLSSLCFILLAAPVLAAQAPGADCSNLVAGHSYANTFGGFTNLTLFNGNPAGLVPNAGAGVITFLPHNVVQARETLMVGLFGLSKDLPVKGTYSLTWDTSRRPVFCTGPVKLILAGPHPVEFDFQMFVDPSADRVEMIHTNPGLIDDFISRPAKTAGCENATIAGKYSYTTTGWGWFPWWPSPDHPLPEQTLNGFIAGAMSGGMQFSPNLPPPSSFPDADEGSARADAWDNLSIDGDTIHIPSSRHMVGWYKLNHDCSGTLVLQDDVGNPVFHIELFVGRAGEEIHAVNIDTAPDADGNQVPMWLFPIPLQRVSPPAVGIFRHFEMDENK